MTIKRFGLASLLCLLVVATVACDDAALVPTAESAVAEAASVNQTETDVQVINAIAEGNADALAKLLIEGANANARSRSGSPALLQATERGDPQFVKLLIDYGADVNAETPNGAILVRAVHEGNQEIVELLLDAGANVNGTGRGWTDNDSALFAAADVGQKDIAELLIKRGADVNQANSNSETALIAAASQAQPEIVSLLLENGADIDHQCDPSGLTALHFAVMAGYEQHDQGLEVLHILLDRGATPDLEDAEGKTPIDLALSSSDFAEMLREAGSADH